MAKLILNNFANWANTVTAVAQLNANQDAIEIAMENTLSRDGTTPNQMLSLLDMNHHQIINLARPTTSSSPLRLQDLSDFLGSGTVSNIPSGGEPGQFLSKLSDADYDLVWADLATSGGNGITITHGSPNVISLRDYISLKDFGAVGDGVTDDAPALRAAVAAMPSGAVLYIPPSEFGYYMNSVVSGAVLALANKSISILGGGWSIKNDGSYAAPTGSVFIMGDGLGDNDDFIHWKGTDAVFGVRFYNFAVVGHTNAFGGFVGRNIIYIQSETLTGDDFYLSNFTMEKCFLTAGKTGYSFFTNANPSTNNGGGALCNSVIRHNQLMQFQLECVGDAVTLENNTIGQNAPLDARNIGIYFWNGPGVTSTRVINNNISSFSGSIVCDGGISPYIAGNELEIGLTSVNLYGSMIDMKGTVGGTVIAPVITGNTVSQNSTVANYIPIRLGNVQNAFVYGNRTSTPSLYSHVQITSGSSGAHIGLNYANVVATPVLDYPITDNGAYTKIDRHFKLTLPGATSGQTVLQPSLIASGTLTLPAATDTLVGKATTDTFTNKSISGSTNTLTNIGNSSLTNSSITINGSSVALGASVTVTAVASAITVGTTTVTSGTTNGLLYNSAGTLGNLATAASGVLVTSAGGVPSISSTLPAHTLGGTISGGNNQINDVVIGAASPHAGTFTTLVATTVNGNTITTGTGTLTLGTGKTATISNTLTLTATDGSTLAIGGGGTLGSNAYTSTAYAPLASPGLTGTPTTPTASADTNTIQIASTAYVLGQSASQANQETATSTVKFVSPGTQQYHPSAAKFWALVTISGGVATLVSGYNVTSVNRGSLGHLTVTFTTSFSSANYAVFCTVDGGGSGTNYANIISQATGNCVVASLSDTGSGGTYADPGLYCVMGFGDQ